MRILQLVRRRKPTLQFARPTELPDIINEAKADAIVAEILAREGKL